MNKRIVSGILIILMFASVFMAFVPVATPNTSSPTLTITHKRLETPFNSLTDGSQIYNLTLSLFAAGVQRTKGDPVVVPLSKFEPWLQNIYGLSISDINWKAVNLTYNGNYIPVQVDDTDLNGILGTAGDELAFLVPENFSTFITLELYVTTLPDAVSAITQTYIEVIWNSTTQDFYVNLGNFTTGNPIIFNITIDHAFPKASGWSAGSIFAASTPSGSDPLGQLDWARSWQLRMFWNHTGGDDWIFSGAQDLNYTLLCYKVGPVRAVIAANYTYTSGNQGMNTTRIYKLYFNQSLVEIEDRFDALNVNATGYINVKVGTSYGLMDTVYQPGYGTRAITDTTWATTDPSSGKYTWVALYDTDSPEQPGFGFVTHPKYLYAVQGGQGFNDIIEFDMRPCPRNLTLDGSSKFVFYITTFDGGNYNYLQDMYDKIATAESLGGTLELQDNNPPAIEKATPYSPFKWRGVEQGNEPNTLEFTGKTFVALANTPVTFMVMTYDDLSGVKNVTIRLELRNATHSLKNFTYVLTEPNDTNTYEVAIGSHPADHYFVYNVTVYDLAGNKAETSGTFNFVVDNTPPTIYLDDISVGAWNDYKSCLLLSGNGTAAMYYTTENWMNIFVNDTVTYDSNVAMGTGVKRVTLYWKVGDTVNQKDMYTNDWGFEHHRYFAPIVGPFSYGTVVEFWFEAEDFAGNTVTSRHFKLVVLGDDKPPVIDSFNYTTPQPDQPVTVTVTAHDQDDPNGSGVDKVFVNYTIDGVNWEAIELNSTNGMYTGNIPAMPANTKVIFEVVVYDKAGNKASERAYYTLLAPKEAGIPTLDIIGVSSIIVALVIAVVIVKFVKPKE